MPQSVLNFTIEPTDEKLTPRAGQIIFGEYLKAIGLEGLCNTYLPHPRSNRGYTPFTFVWPLVMMLHSGGKSLENIRTIISDRALGEIHKMPTIPTADATGKWLKRYGLIGIYAIEKISQTLLKRYLENTEEDLVLDIDATLIESYKSTAETTYKMFPGFSPMIGHLNGGYVIHSEFRSGNIAPADHNLDFVKRCIVQLPNSSKRH